MMSVSLMAVPVLLETTTDPTQLVRQWARTYHYGHQIAPTLAVTTFLLYAYTTVSKRAAARRWAVFTAAGVTSIAMVPFTWIVMSPTNNKLFALEAGAGSKIMAAATFGEAVQLVNRWSTLHLVRSLFPLAGSVIGLTGTLGELKY